MWRLIVPLLMALAAHAECRLGRIAELPIAASQDGLIVEARINGEPARFNLDTGSATTVINTASIERLGLRSIRPDHGLGALAVIEGLGGGVSARAVEAHSFDLGGLRARDYGFVAANLPVFSKSTQQPDGLLSTDLLAKYDIDFDLAAGRIRLYYPMTDCSHPSAYMHGPLYMTPMLPGSDERSPRIAVEIGGQSYVAVIDTGADRSLVFAPASRRLKAAVVTDAVAVGLAGKRVRVSRTILPAMSVSDLEFGNFPALLSLDTYGDIDHPVDMLLGMDFVRAVHLWLSFSSRTVILQYPPS